MNVGEQPGAAIGGEAGDDFLKTYCATHPKTETRLRCGKCDRPICPKCLVYTPVGTRCRTCANLKPLPMFQVRFSHYVRALAAALAVVAVGGFLWAAVARAIPSFAFWIVLVMGYLTGEAISRATNRKRGRPLQVIAAVTLLLTYLAYIVALYLVSGFMAGEALDFALRQFGDLFSHPIDLLIVAVSAYVATSRI